LEVALRWTCDGSTNKRQGDGARPVVQEGRRLGNGVVQRAVIKALVEAGRAMSVREAHSAVEALLGRSVSLDSVSSSLSTGARGTRCRFERVERGWYQLARSR
jgi:hypothetical protein